jgi:O-antigen/teichoic acid export membrane protein
LKELKQLGKDSIIYGLGGALANGIGFFLLPVYTRVFTPADYGTKEMLTLLSSFLAAFMAMGMDSAQSFYFFKQKENGVNAQARVVTAILQWRLVWGTTCVVLIMFFTPLLNKFFFHGGISWHFFAIAFFAALFTQIMKQSSEVFRLLYKPVKYLSITIAHTLSSAAVALILIIVFNKGIIGFFLGSLIASIGAAFWGWWLIRDYIDWSAWHLDWWPRLLKFGAPLVPSGFAMYVLHTSDRWFITSFRGPDELGLYSVGAKFALMIALSVQTFRLAWWPVAMDSLHKEEGKSLFRTVGRFYMGLGIAMVVLLTAMSPLLVGIFAAPAYFLSYPIVGVLGWYPIFYGFYMIGSCGMWKAEKTIWAPLFMGGAAILNIVLNALLVPEHGSMGAAIATSVSFFIWIVLSLYISERLWKVGYAYFVLLGQIIVGALACIAILHIYHSGINYVLGFSVAVGAMLLLGLSSVSREHMRKVFLRVHR